MSDLDQLERDLHNYRNSRAAYSTRLSEVTRIRNGMSDALTDIICRINKKLDRTGDNIEDGIQGISSTKFLAEQLAEAREALIDGDPQLSRVLANLDQEIRRCQDEINRLNVCINQTCSAIQDAKEAEENNPPPLCGTFTQPAGSFGGGGGGGRF